MQDSVSFLTTLFNFFNSPTYKAGDVLDSIIDNGVFEKVPIKIAGDVYAIPAGAYSDPRFRGAFDKLMRYIHSSRDPLVARNMAHRIMTHLTASRT